MSLYIKPPSGIISLKTLESFAINRLNFLMKLIEAKTTDPVLIQSIIDNSVDQSHCLISGTQKDNISHFTLRLILSQDNETSQFLLEAEKILFKFRCWCMTEDELYRFLKTFNKLTSTNSHTSDTLSVALKSVLELKHQCENSWRKVALRYFNPGDGLFQFPFQTVLPLVYHRLIVLKHGIAFVPCSQLPVFLTEIFSLFLDTGIKQARNRDVSDDRLKFISEIILRRCRRFLKRNTKIRNQSTLVQHVNKHSIDNQSQIFPPCMINLHQTLRDRHRLNHHARIQYTLFLKELGMNVDDAIEFWREEYSQPAGPDTTWGTEWKRAASRYSYNIRHLYGLEGSHRNYSAHCCQSLQNQIIKPQDVGGCPFVHFDLKNFQNFLLKQNLTEKHSKHLINLKNCGKYNDACAYFRDCVLSQNVCEVRENYQEESRQQDGAVPLSGARNINYNLGENLVYNDTQSPLLFDHEVLSQVQLERSSVKFDDEVLSKKKTVPLERQSLNIDTVKLSKTETMRPKIVDKEIIPSTDHSKRWLLKNSDKCKLVDNEVNSENQTLKRRSVDITENKEWRTRSGKHKLVHSESSRSIEDQNKLKTESKKCKVDDKEIRVLTNCERYTDTRDQSHYQMSGEGEEDFGCNHNDCASQRVSSQSASTFIEKPSDYCLSYLTLLYKLQHLS